MDNITFELNGGLGNQIFQYLAAIYTQEIYKSKKINYCLSSYIKKGFRELEINNLLKEPINFKDHLASEHIHQKYINKLINQINYINNKKKFNLKVFLNILNEINEPEIKYFSKKNTSLDIFINLINEIEIKSKIKSIIAKGFWQNPTSYSNKIELMMKNFIDTKIFLPKNIEPNKFITIHIRRGDFIENNRIYDYYFSRFSPLQYINIALSIIPNELSKLPIFVITDDINWAKEYKDLIKKYSTQTLQILNNNDPKVDWSIMNQARLNIAANSTFSYTAAMLNFGNKEAKLRCIVPQWISREISAEMNGWLSFQGFVGI